MIEDLIYTALMDAEDIADVVAGFDGEPAIFYQQAPNDMEEHWDGEQYPRIDYTVDWQFNPERQVAGTLIVNVWCLNNQPIAPDEIEGYVKACLKDLFLTKDGETYSTAWNRSDAFEAGGGNEPLTVGTTITFDILAYPVQYTTIPDPIEGQNLWIKQLLPDAMVIGVDDMPELFRPTKEEPVIYCRLIGDISNMRNSYAVAWMVVTIGIHVFSTDATARQLVCREIINALSLEGEVLLTDDSPMIIQKTAITMASDPLRTGQIAITGQYGVLRKERPERVLQNVGVVREVIS